MNLVLYVVKKNREITLCMKDTKIQWGSSQIIMFFRTYRINWDMNN